MGYDFLSLAYILASVTFIIGLKMLSDPATARKGNLIAAAGMAVAVLGTLFLRPVRHLEIIAVALIIGAIAGTLTARKVRMTAMPELVSLFNGMGGACAALISLIEFHQLTNLPHSQSFETYAFAHLPPLPHLMDVMTSTRLKLVVVLAGLIIGSVSFAGSIIAWAKLNARMKDMAFKGQHIVNLFLFVITLITAIFVYHSITSPFIVTSDTEINLLLGHVSPLSTKLFYSVFALSLLYGVAFVLPIGGADMPVVISLLNSFTGIAAACGGFLYDNKAMLTGGILVGAAGTVLTILMCKAMNRSLRNVLIGSFGGSPATATGHAAPQGSYKEIPVSDAAMLLNYAHKVMIVPGYGLAVAQAQHACHDLEKLLTEKGVEVKYAIHPVAGRMPGHMNVLLAEADVSYDNLLELEQANEEFPSTDVVIVLGANDVVNPAAKNDPSSPIYGMPILDVEQARNCIVNKRSMKPGYAGIENELFFRPKTSMLFGDAKSTLQKLITEIKNL